VLRQRGMQSVWLTRNRDLALSAEDRQASANRHHTGVFISLHLARLSDRSTNLRVFVSRFLKDPELAKMASKEVEAGIRVLPADFAQNSMLKHSQRLGRTLIQAWQLAGFEFSDSRAELISGVPIAVLKAVHSAAVHVEVPPRLQVKGPGLEDPAFRRRIAEALADGIEMFLSRR